MSSPPPKKRTSLYEAHRRLGARMVDFAGWEMPVQYAGILEEVRTVRQKAGLFDLGHMGEIEISGAGAAALLQRLTPNDVARLAPGRSHYTALLTERGTFVDDILVYRLAVDRFLLCVNASNTEKDFDWIASQAGPAVRVEDVSDAWGLIALQGPLARTLVAGPSKNHFKKSRLAGVEVILAGTGYTGEDGLEIFCPAGEAERIWNDLLKKGTREGLQPAGLGARDTLRLEAAYPLYGHEIDETTTPDEAALSWIVKIEKGDFIGREALIARRRNAPERRLAGLVMEDPGIPRQGHKLFSEAGKEIGAVTSGTFSPTLDKAIALGYVKGPSRASGGKIRVDIRGEKRQAVVVSLPFYKRGK